MFRLKKSRFVLVVAVLVAAGIAARQALLPHRHFFTTQRPGEPPRVWRSMRTAWKFDPGIEGYHSQISQLLVRNGRLYYVCECEAGCVDTANGALLWRFPLISLSATVNASPSSDDWRSLAADGRYLYLSHGRSQTNGAPPCFDVQALRLGDGGRAWERSLPDGLAGEPCRTANLLLCPMIDGTVLALGVGQGETVWRNPVTFASPGRMRKDSGFVVQANDEDAVAQIGPGRLAAFRVRDGATLWRYSAKQATDEGSSGGPQIAEGVAYALLSDTEMLAFDLRSGKRLWLRTSGGSGSPSSDVIIAGDILVTAPFSECVGLRRKDGVTRWTVGPPPREAGRPFESGTPYAIPWHNDAAGIVRADPGLFLVSEQMPLVNGRERRLRTTASVSAVALLDPATGRERWRWQPDKGYKIDKIASDGERLIVSDGQSIHGIEDGEPQPLPSEPPRRRALAEAMVLQNFDWSPRQGAVTQGVYTTVQYRSQVEKFNPINLIKQLIARRGLPQTPLHREMDPDLTLVRLGSDSAPALLAYMRYELTQQTTPQATSAGAEPDYSVSDGLNRLAALLLDIGDHSVVPALAREMDRSKHRGARRLLAETLIRFGDPQAAPALFRFARSESNSPSTRLDSLYWLCRLPPAAVNQTEMMKYLLSALVTPRVAAPIRLFARFELLRDRGVAARRSALAAFVGEPRTRLLPPTVDLVKSNRQVIMFTGSSGPGDRGALAVQRKEGQSTYQTPILSKTRDEEGRKWVVFTYDYLADESDVWITSSSDSKRWPAPAYVMNLTSLQAYGWGGLRIAVNGGELEVKWKTVVRKGGRPVVETRHSRITLADIYRDSDGDGLPDRLEERIGTDPNKRDTNGDGIPDGEDKNPAYRPHLLTDEEGILQAVVEALCQTRRSDRDVGADPMAYGGGDRALVLRVPPGSKGVRILGHPGVVLCRSNSSANSFAFDWSAGSFASPAIDLRGAFHTDSRSLIPVSPDPFDTGERSGALSYVPRMPTFQDSFPYERSSDGKRARVGWFQQGVFLGRAAPSRYDVEVWKIDGRWVPVECRMISGQHRFGSGQAVLPEGVDPPIGEYWPR